MDVTREGHDFASRHWIDQPEPWVLELVEMAYRRGYAQGYDEGAHNACFASPEVIDAFQAGALHGWRYDDHQGDNEPPPELHLT